MAKNIENSALQVVNIIVSQDTQSCTSSHVLLTEKIDITYLQGQ